MATALPQPVRRHVSSYFYLHRYSGESRPVRLTPDGKDELDPERKRFAPLDVDDRFTPVACYWVHGEPFVEAPETAKIDRGECPEPRSFADVPPFVYTASPGGCFQPLSTREAAFADAARANRRSWNQRKRVWLMEWVLVVEMGQCEPCGDIEIDLSASGIGSQEETIYRPVRLVVPTADELRRYAIPSPRRVETS